MMYLAIYVESILLSVIMDFIQELRYYKNVADTGNKINQVALRKFQKEHHFSFEVNPLFYFIPIYNIIKVFANSANYDVIRSELFNIIGPAGCIDKMNKKEKRRYNRHPSMLNAYLISLQSKQRLKDTIMMPIHEESKEDSAIYFDYHRKKYEIVDVVGPLENRNQEEQEQVFIDNLEHFLDVNIEHLLFSSVVNGDEVDEKLKLLKEMKREFLKQKDVMSKKKTLTKKL